MGSGACKYLQMNQLLLKNVANFKCDQKWIKNDHFATFSEVESKVPDRPDSYPVSISYDMSFKRRFL